MNEVLISVVIPIYNVGKYIANTIDSVQKQDFPNYEIILVNDGSIDNSGEICDAFAKQDSRISVVHKTNSGVMSARFAGVDLSKGKYIAFLDGDDMMPPNALSSLYRTICSCDADYAIGACVDVNENGSEIPHSLFKSQFKLIDDNRAYRTHFAKHPRGMNIKLYKKSLLLSEPRIIIPPSIRNNEDFIFNLFLSSKINKVIATDDVVAKIVIRQGSASRVSYKTEYWLNLFDWVDSQYQKYDVYKKDYMYYKLMSLFYNVIIVDQMVDYRHPCFDNVRNQRYYLSFGIKRNLTIFIVKHPWKILRYLLFRVHPKRILYKILGK